MQSLYFNHLCFSSIHRKQLTLGISCTRAVRDLGRVRARFRPDQGSNQPYNTARLLCELSTSFQMEVALLRNIPDPALMQASLRKSHPLQWPYAFLRPDLLFPRFTSIYADCIQQTRCREQRNALNL